jgi:Amt family ammonium transporter
MKKLVAKGAASLALLSLSALPVLAQDTEAAPAVTPEVAYIFNTLLFLIGGFLVMWMAAGFAMLEAGLVRSKNVSMQCLKNISLYSIAGLMFWITGYNLMYTGVDGGFMGSFGPYSFDPVGGNARTPVTPPRLTGSSRWCLWQPQRLSSPVHWLSVSSSGRS